MDLIVANRKDVTNRKKTTVGGNIVATALQRVYSIVEHRSESNSEHSSL